MISLRAIARFRGCKLHKSKLMSTKSGTPPDRQEHMSLTSDQPRNFEIMNAKLTKIKTLSPTVKGYQLKFKEASSFKAGQWVDFFIPGVDMVGGFSMCGPPSTLEKDKLMELAVKYSEWPPAYWLHTKGKEGDDVAVRIGGNFHYPDPDTEKVEDHEILLIAGGVGINPLASIYFHINDLIEGGNSKCRKVHLMYSAKSEEELLFKEDLDKIAEKRPGTFSVEYIRTQTEKESRINHERIQKVLKTNFQDKEKVFCYLCGPPQMIKDLAKTMSIPRRNIKFELWW